MISCQEDTVKALDRMTFQIPSCPEIFESPSSRSLLSHPASEQPPNTGQANPLLLKTWFSLLVYLQYMVKSLQFLCKRSLLG